MPIAKKEVDLLKDKLGKIRVELAERFGCEMTYAEYRPRPSDLFEYFVFYNALLSVKPDKILLNRIRRGNYRSSGGLPIPAVKSQRTVWKMGSTLHPDATLRKESNELSFWFDKALAPRIRPDIVVRGGHFEIRRDFPEPRIQLTRDEEPFAEYCNRTLEGMPGYFVETQHMNWPREGMRFISFRAKEEFKYPPLVIECKSFGARLGNPQKYATYAESVVVVSPEKLYEPRSEKIHIVRVTDFDEKDLRARLKPSVDAILGRR